MVGAKCLTCMQKCYLPCQVSITHLLNKPLLGNNIAMNFYCKKNSKTALLFSAPDTTITCPDKATSNKNQLHIIAGRTHAKNLLQQGKLHAQFDWLDDEFAIDTTNNIIVCPYFDYRQLSNIKIARLSELVAQLKK